MKNAIISAAGWKGSGIDVGLAGCPESFLPLGNGSTPLSRTAGMLSDAGYTVYIAMGKRGYPYSRYIRWTLTSFLPEFSDDFPWNGSPWTQERYDYASEIAEVIEVRDPGGWSTSLDTLCEAMDAIGKEKWENLFLACGDMVMPEPCFKYILSQEIPFIFSFTAYHVYFGMDLPGAEFFRKYTEPYRRFRDADAWLHEKALSPNYQGVDVLKEKGFQHVQLSTAPPCKWVDVDTHKTYQKARRLIAEGFRDDK